MNAKAKLVETTDRGRWREKGLPHSGWSCVSVEDIGHDARETCEMCLAAEVRYVHLMIHPDHREQLRCGCVCAGHLEGNPEAAKKRDTTAKQDTQRRRKQELRRIKEEEKKRLAAEEHARRQAKLREENAAVLAAWNAKPDELHVVRQLGDTWRTSAKGNPYTEAGGFLFIISKRKSGGFGVGVTPKRVPNAAPVWGRVTYASKEEAKRGCLQAYRHMTKASG